MENASRYGPHDDAKQEEAHGENSVIDSCLFGSPMAAAEVCPEDQKTEEERDTGGSEDDVLGPGLRSTSPGREIAAWFEVLGGQEDVDGGTDESEDDETAAEVYTTEEQLDCSHADLCFL